MHTQMKQTEFYELSEQCRKDAERAGMRIVLNGNYGFILSGSGGEYYRSADLLCIKGFLDGYFYLNRIIGEQE